MSFAVYQQITESSIIDACLVSSFTAASAKNLIISKGDHLEVWNVNKRTNKLSFVYSVPLFGRVEALGTYRPKLNGPEHICAIFKRSRYLSVLRHEGSLGNVRTCGQHLLIPPNDPASTSGPTGFKSQIAVDPEQRCLAVRVLPDRVLIFPIAEDAKWQHEAGPAASNKNGDLSFHEDAEFPPGLEAPFTIGAQTCHRLHHIQDVAFLHGYKQPTMACLGQTKLAYGGCLNDSNLNTSSILVYALDFVERAPRLIWAFQKLPHDMFQVVPLSLPLGGMLALCSNTAIYLKEHGSSFCQILNPSAQLGEETSILKAKGVEIKDEAELEIQLTGCVVSVLSPTTLLFSVQPVGRIYLAHFVLDSREVVTDIVWTAPGIGAPSSCVCSIDEEYVFLAAAASTGGCSLLKLQPTRKKLPPSLQKHQPRKRQKRNPADVPSKSDQEADSDGDGGGTGPATGKNVSEHLAALLEVHGTLQDAARHIRSFNAVVVDEIASHGAIQCMAQWCRDRSDEPVEEVECLAGTQRFICSSGTGDRAYLDVIQRAVPLETLTEFDLPSCTRFSALWSFCRPKAEPVVSEAMLVKDQMDHVKRAAAVTVARLSDQGVTPDLPTHRMVLISGEGRSMMLETTEDIEEISKLTKLDAEATTICAGSVLDRTVVVQVTPDCLRFLDARNPRGNGLSFEPHRFKRENGASEDEKIRKVCGGAVDDPYVVVRFDDFSLQLLAVCAENDIIDLTEHLPDSLRSNSVIHASLCLFQRPNVSSGHLLVALTAQFQGTIRVVDLSTMNEVFKSEHIFDVPPVLRDHLAGDVTCGFDHLRPISDVCAPINRGVADLKLLRSKELAKGPESNGAAAAAALVVSAEFVEVDADDVGPTLVVMIVGRPIIVYRAFIPASEQSSEQPSAFPWQFTIVQHNFLSLVERPPAGPHRATVVITPHKHKPNSQQTAGGGSVVVPPHAGIPCLWLAAQRNVLFVHPLPGTTLRAITQLQAPCCGSGFFALSQADGAESTAAQVLAPAVAAELGPNCTFELRFPVPLARKAILKTPHVLATNLESGLVGLAVSESVLEAEDAFLGPNPDDDPLGEDYSIVRNPPVETDPPPMRRVVPQYEVWIEDAKNLGKIGRYRFPCDNSEHVLCMHWVTFPGLPQPSLVVGTGVNTGEDLTCRGRILIFSIAERDPGVLSPIYQRALKWPVTTIGQWGSYLVHSEGFKLYFEKWENSNFNKLALFDASMCVTSMSIIKNFLLLGDLRKGIDFVQWKEEAATQTRNLRRLSRSPPSSFMSVLACDFIVCGKSLGLVALDHAGIAHLYQYSPHSDGREGDQLLRSCATFAMGYPCRAAIRLQTEAGVQSMIMASGGGEIVCIRPIDDQAYRVVATLLGMLATRLPHRCGLNPRAFRHHEGSPPLVAPRKNIEDAVLLKSFAFLSSPLQSTIAEKMRLPIITLMNSTLPSASCQLFNLSPVPANASTGGDSTTK